MKQYFTRYNIALVLAIIGSILSVIGWVGVFKGNDAFQVYVVGGMFFALIAYIFGGLLTALKMAVSIAKWGIFFDSFPLNILNVLVAFVLAVIILLFLPVFPVLKARSQYQNA